MKYTIEKGDQFKCKKTVVMTGDYYVGQISYIKGNTYISEMDNCITDEQKFKRHFWDDDINDLLAHFTLIY